MLEIEKCNNGYVIYGGRSQERHESTNYDKVNVFETSKSMYEFLEKEIGFKEKGND